MIKSRGACSLVLMSAIILALILPFIVIDPSLEYLNRHIVKGQSNVVPISVFLAFWVLIIVYTVAAILMYLLFGVWILRKYMNDSEFESLIGDLGKIEFFGVLLARVFLAQSYERELRETGQSDKKL